MIFNDKHTKTQTRVLFCRKLLRRIPEAAPILARVAIHFVFTGDSELILMSVLKVDFVPYGEI